MPSPPTTIRVAPSRLGWAAQVMAASGVLGLLWGYAPWWMSLAGAGVLAGVVLDAARRRPRGELRLMPRPRSAPDWAWRERAGDDWREVSLSCDYLGPWLVGLRLDGRRLWLWPDSSDADSLRVLRRALNTLP
ncbi:hypothetical protein ACFPTY_05800 [Halomonas beimenensis]